MANRAHLEEMGRELKCPICLCLLDSAVSLGCNHMFCSSCISKTMKAAASNCPVCKVPFHRREVRPAPHMDSLVAIYKNMETAAGVALFSSQAAAMANQSDGLNHDVSLKDSGLPDSEAHKEKTMKKGVPAKKGNKSKQCNAKSSDSSHISTVPSFSSNKRVHVTPYPISETPQRPAKNLKLGVTETECKADTGLDISQSKNNSPSKEKEVINLNENVDPMFSPFFWLREDADSDELPGKPSSQQTADSDMPIHVAPCFSDINDSDDDSPVKTNHVNNPNAAEVFDSEMFDWTQRACSSKLCSTPIKRQVVEEHETDVIGHGCELNFQSEFAGMKSECQKAVGRVKKKITKRKMAPACRVRKKNVKRSINKKFNSDIDAFLLAEENDNEEIAQNSSLEYAASTQATILPLVKKCSSISSLQSHRDDNQKDKENKLLSAQHNEAKSRNHVNDKELPPFVSQNTELDDTSRTRNAPKNKKAKSTSHQNCMKISIDDAIAEILEEVPPYIGQQKMNQENQVKEGKLPATSNRVVADSEVKDSSDGANKSVSNTQSRRQATRSNWKNRLTMCATALVIGKDSEKNEAPVFKDNSTTIETDCINLTKKSKAKSVQGNTDILRSDQDKGVDIAHISSVNQSVKDKMTPDNKGIFGDFSPKKLGMPLQIHETENNCLRKCNKNSSKMKCAFCQSSAETKVSGEMMHFFNGKPVAADYGGGIVVHSHKHCTEWSPNVYFDNEIAVNLNNELARSKRIKCSCCGINGAALGCYEKSCRKSFHFTCAKLIPQCRWDTDNFVMLCPLHHASKLPYEVSVQEPQKKRKISPKREPQAHCKAKPEQWKCSFGSAYKWVLCCSALNESEKEIVSLFSKLSGVSVSKAWTPNVTHVIASTDENGACKRTLKVLMGIIEGKWILKLDWLQACLKMQEPVNEEPFEIKVDNHGINDGPRLGRLRTNDQKPKLLCGLKFYFMEGFTSTYKGYLNELVIAAGGAVLQRKPISRDKLLDETSEEQTYIIYSHELPENHKPSPDDVLISSRYNEAKLIADASGSKVANNTWILDSIAACTLQSLG